MSNYIAVVHRDAKGNFSVAFPDFPGCSTAGDTIDDVKDAAQSALTIHMKELLDAEKRIPMPSKLEDIINGPDYAGAVAVLVVTAPDAKSRSIRVNITMPEDTLHQIDATAKKKGMSRSSFLAHAAQRFQEAEYREAIPVLEGARNHAAHDTTASMLLAEAYTFGRSPEDIKADRAAYDRAMALFDEVLAREPGNMLARLRRAALRSAVIPAEESLAEQRQLVEEARGSQFEAVSELELARRHLMCGQGNQALLLYGRLHAEHSWLACVLHSEIGVCHAMLGDHPSAIQSFLHAVEETTPGAMSILQKTSRELMGDAYWAYWSSVDNLSVRQSQNHAWLAGLFSVRDDMTAARQHLQQAVAYLHADEVGKARDTLKREFVLRIKQMFPKLSGEEQIMKLKQTLEDEK